MKFRGWVALFLVGCGASRHAGGGEMCAEPAESLGSWQAMALPPANVGALEPAFAWTGQELLVWGGIGLHTENGGCVPCNGGAAYDPRTDTWRAWSSVNAPTPRDWTAGVWTGETFITWGGLPGNPQGITLADQVGGSYDLAKDSWQSLSTAGQPKWRFLHTLAWSGSLVLVWGGSAPDNTRLCDGGRFDPVQNTWQSMSLEGAPAGCAEPASVWTGSELVVWGGEEADGLTIANTGAAYNPVTDSWRPISAVGAPTARAHPAVVWTGQEMVVYGGNAGVDARAYDPQADRWRSLSLRGAPGLHGSGDAVWTGTEMLLWGATDCDVGGRYNLASNSWQSFSSKGALLPRSDQTMLWTGNALLIYGGSVGTDLQQDTNSGAQYTP
jgi:N-acetylneuraminic acid mutarotase